MDEQIDLNDPDVRAFIQEARAWTPDAEQRTKITRRRYYEQHREKLLAQQRERRDSDEYRETRREYMREWNAKHRKRQREYKREYMARLRADPAAYRAYLDRANESRRRRKTQVVDSVRTEQTPALQRTRETPKAV